jgi:hypothetical protein
MAERCIESYRRAPDFMSITNVDMVCLQHEFRLFGGPACSHILASFDLTTPEKYLLRGDTWLLGPETSYERESDVDDVVFLCGFTVASDGDTLNVCCSVADRCIALATASIREMLEWLRRCGNPSTLSLG